MKELEYLKGLYPDWKALTTMRHDQIIAIYLRIKAKEQNDTQLKSVTTNRCQAAVYFCDTCLATFTSDNPALSECMFCGSKTITKE